MSNYIIPLLLSVVALLALRKQENSYDIMVQGAKDGFRMMLTIGPSLIILLTSVSMLRSSGAIEAFSSFLAPALSHLGIPPETILLMLVRPISGSAGLAIGAELMMVHGPDSLIGRTAAVMLGSSETTFYTISVYLGSCGISKSRYALPAALLADLSGFLAAAWTVRWFM